MLGTTKGDFTVIEDQSLHDERQSRNRRVLTVRCPQGHQRHMTPHKFKGHSGRCRECNPSVYKTPEYYLLGNAKYRAKKAGLPCSITLADIVIPDRCPLLDIPIIIGKDDFSPNSPSLDRLICEKGYVPGNILVISRRANTIKHNASLDELMLLTDNLHNILISEAT